MQVNPALGSIVPLSVGQKEGAVKLGFAQSEVPISPSVQKIDSAGDGGGVSKSRSSERSQSKQNGSISKADLQESLKKLNEAAQLYRKSSLQFTIDKDANTTVVKVIDSQTNQVIRQIPSEDALRIAKAIDDFKGLLLKDKA